MNDVVILVADKNYLDHARALEAGCRRQGLWEKDVCLIHQPGVDHRGFTHHLEVQETGFFAKFQIFADFFRQWDRALYLDCDILIQDDIRPIFNQLSPDRRLICTREGGHTLGAIKYWSKEENVSQTIYDEIERERPWTLERMWNTACVLYYPIDLPTSTVEDLTHLQEKYSSVNVPGRGGTDQQIINLHEILYKMTREVDGRAWCFWGFDEPQNLIDSEYWNWHADDKPAILHYTRWFAPWLPKKPHGAAYLIRRLNRPCLEVYQENLQSFKERNL